MLLIISDGSSEEMHQQHDVVLRVLASLGAADKPTIDVINKIDRLDATPQWPGAIGISAKTGEGIDALLDEIARHLRGVQRAVRIEIPYAQGGLLSMLHEGANVLSEEYNERGVVVEAMIDDELSGRIAGKLGSEALCWID